MTLIGIRDPKRFDLYYCVHVNTIGKPEGMHDFLETFQMADTLEEVIARGNMIQLSDIIGVDWRTHDASEYICLFEHRDCKIPWNESTYVRWTLEDLYRYSSKYQFVYLHDREKWNYFYECDFWEIDMLTDDFTIRKDGRSWTI